jgi:hypothetical protein
MTNPTSQPYVGDLQITLARAGLRYTIAGAELAKLVGSPGIVIRLAAVLYAHGAGSGLECPPEQGRQAAAKQQAAGNLRPEIERTACYLAERLNDGRSLSFYRRVAENVPSDVVRESLVRALDVKAANIRRSRAAYFTSIIRPYLQRRLPDS